ncbi:MAG: flagellar basal body rod protein FlgC [Chloroflexi bacterium]|nr:flagellar basal body rod protein FlgC [Chloroflexota bacterium]
MSLFSSLRISGSALTAQRVRMDVIANNIANAESTKSANGQPYRRQEVVFSPISAAPGLTVSTALDPRRVVGNGVQVTRILQDDAPPHVVYDPSHPDADNNGNVAYPNVDIITEMTDMISATRAYEANVTALNAAKSMAMKSLDIARG